MPYEYRVFNTGTRYEYEIINNANEAIIRQDIHPDYDCLVNMDEATAISCAEMVIARLLAAE
jgi:hypothetical protein